MSAESPNQRLLQAGRKTRDSLRVIRDVVRQKRKANLYDETFIKLEEAVEHATDGLIEIARIFEEVLQPNNRPATTTDVVDLRALQESLADMQAEREELIKSLRDAQRQLQKYADDLQILYTQERAKRAELAEAYSQLEQANQLKTDFLTTITHELSTPLVPIDLSLQVIEKSGLSSSQQQSMTEVHEHLQKYKRQLDGLIKYADLINQPHVVRKSHFEVAPIVHDMLTPLTRFAQGRHVTVNVQPIEDGLHIWGDPDLIGNLIYQLTHNAIKFNRPGGKVDVAIYREDGGYSFVFADDGVGIPPSVMERFGQDFNQIVDALKRGEEGLGLGLALSNYIANVHNGQLTASANTPKGTVVKLWLPEGD